LHLHSFGKSLNQYFKNIYYGNIYFIAYHLWICGSGIGISWKDPEIWKYIADKVSKEGFPESDQSIPVSTTKITTIDTNFDSDKDPLASVPMSRVSNEAKQKMAEIAKQDITNQLEKNADKFASIFPEAVEYTDEYFKPDYSNQTKCGCGRSETGFCTGLHRIPKKDWAAGVREIPAEKPKRKTTKKTK